MDLKSWPQIRSQTGFLSRGKFSLSRCTQEMEGHPAGPQAPAGTGSATDATVSPPLMRMQDQGNGPGSGAAVGSMDCWGREGWSHGLPPTAHHRTRAAMPSQHSPPRHPGGIEGAGGTAWSRHTLGYPRDAQTPPPWAAPPIKPAAHRSSPAGWRGRGELLPPPPARPVETASPDTPPLPQPRSIPSPLSN